MRTKRPPKATPAARQEKPTTRTTLPMLLQPRDLLIDEEGVWEVINRPWSTRYGQLIHATVQKAGEPRSRRDKNWGAHELLVIRRA